MSKREMMRADIEDKCNVLSLSSLGSHRLLVFNWGGGSGGGRKFMRGSSIGSDQKKESTSVRAYF